MEHSGCVVLVSLVPESARRVELTWLSATSFHMPQGHGGRLRATDWNHVRCVSSLPFLGIPPNAAVTQVCHEEDGAGAERKRKSARGGLEALASFRLD